MSASFAFSASSTQDQARELYTQTEYAKSLALLNGMEQKDAGAFELMGQDEYMLGEYKKSTDAFEKAAKLDPNDSEIYHWLGRAYGRRAEAAIPFKAPGYANKARQMFEKAVELDPSNKEAVNDLFDYYLRAPGFLGGGTEKAEALVSVIAKDDPAEGHYAQAQLDDKRKQYDSAEEHLRQAVELAPLQVGRVVDLATFLSNRGRTGESDAMFERAMAMAPNNPKVLYARAETYIKEHRNLDQARELLQKFLSSPLTVNDPPRTRAEALLRKSGA